MTVAPAPPRPATTVTAPSGDGRAPDGGAPDGRAPDGGAPDLLDHLRSPATPRPAVDRGLAGGLRAWLEDGVAACPAVGTTVVRDGALASSSSTAACGSAGVSVSAGVGVGTGVGTGVGVGARRHTIGLPDVRSSLTRVLFRLTTTTGPLRNPFEDALCAISVTDRGPEILDAVGRLRSSERAALRAFARRRAATIAVHWRAVPAAWLPRTAERLRVPLAGGAVTLCSSADLVVGRPSDGTASVCLVRLHEARGALSTDGSAARVRRAMALAETLRSGAPPWLVATYDPGTGRVQWEEAGEALLVAAVRDVFEAIGR